VTTTCSRSQAHPGQGVPFRPLSVKGACARTGSEHLYSVSALTDASGAVVERYGYDAYGKRVILDGTGTTVRTASSFGNNIGFTGREFDPETGLWYFRARMYSDRLGRFVSRDPAGYVDGYALYNGYYVPNKTDPKGRISCSVTGTPGLEYSGLLHRNWSNNVITPWVVDVGYAEAKVSIQINGMTVNYSATSYARVDDSGWISTDQYIVNSESSGSAKCVLEDKRCVWRESGAVPAGDYDNDGQAQSSATVIVSGYGTDTLAVSGQALGIATQPGEGPLSVGVGVGAGPVSINLDPSAIQANSGTNLVAFVSKAANYKCNCVDK